MTSSLTIQPFAKPVSGAITLPGSKSITNRALLLAALSQGSTRLTGALFSEDTRIMIECLRHLGYTVQEDEATRQINITGHGGIIPEASAELYVGNAGTAARFLTAFLCLHPGGTYRLDGSEPMRRRPMSGLLDALIQHGAADVQYHGQPGHFPFTLKTHGIRGGQLDVDASASSQILSALLMVMPCASAQVALGLQGETVSHPFIDMTLSMMRQFGAQPTSKSGQGTYSCINSGYPTQQTTYPIEPDATAASYYLMLPWLTGGSLRLHGCAGVQLQGDIDFTEIIKGLGAHFDEKDSDLIVSYPQRKTSGGTHDFNAISDTFLTLAAVAPLLDSPLTITGIAHTRKQETDRIHAMATELRRLGQRVDESPDSLTIHPDREALRRASAEQPVSIHTYEDHRVAMSFGILGSHDLHGDGRPWITILDHGCCAKTFPNFFEVLTSLRPA